MGTKWMTSEEKQQAIDLYQSGKSAAEVGRLVGRSGRGITMILEKAGIEVRLPRFENLVGREFAWLTVLEFLGSSSGQRLWRCVCRCGKEVIVPTGLLNSKNTKSCGCYQKFRQNQTLTKHGACKGGIRSEYTIWANMRSRCLNPNDPAYDNYGGRGITVCERWRESFAEFLGDMGERPSKRHSLDRTNNDGSYSPENCRWATVNEQASNRRSNHLIEYNGQTKTLCAWAIEFGINYRLLSQRLKTGMPVERALNTPTRRKLDGKDPEIQWRRLYAIWKGILVRCYKTSGASYKDYGGRGIEVCQRWRDHEGFHNFLADMGTTRPSEKHSLHRVDNNGPYSPENCVWATTEDQIGNKRSTRLLEFNGKTQHIAAWARETGIYPHTISDRLARGWTPEQALTTPVR